jgi:hypothetical protein
MHLGYRNVAAILATTYKRLYMALSVAHALKYMHDAVQRVIDVYQASEKMLAATRYISGSFGAIRFRCMIGRSSNKYIITLYNELINIGAQSGVEPVRTDYDLSLPTYDSYTVAGASDTQVISYTADHSSERSDHDSGERLFVGHSLKRIKVIAIRASVLSLIIGFTAYVILEVAR